jgi:hypothetical protein
MIHAGSDGLLVLLHSIGCRSSQHNRALRVELGVVRWDNQAQETAPRNRHSFWLARMLVRQAAPDRGRTKLSLPRACGAEYPQRWAYEPSSRGRHALWDPLGH